MEWKFNSKSDNKKIIVDYDKFCDNPSVIYDEIIEKLNTSGYSISKNYSGNDLFNASKKNNPELERRIQSHLNFFIASN